MQVLHNIALMNPKVLSQGCPLQMILSSIVLLFKVTPHGSKLNALTVSIIKWCFHNEDV